MRHNFLFDLDQTLLNFHASEHIALKNVVSAHGFEFTEDLYAYFKVRNKELWLQYEKALITRQDIYTTRFGLLFEKLGADTSSLDLLAINSEFIVQMSHNGVLMDGALDFVKRIRDTFSDSKIYIVTNGVKINADGRIKSTGLDEFIDGVYISEVMGVTKPAAEFFERVIDDIGQPKSSYIVVGDSLSSDMLGAKNAGLASCWFMPKESVVSEDAVLNAMREYEIDYKADSFDELYEVLVKWVFCKTR